MTWPFLFFANLTLLLRLRLLLMDVPAPAREWWAKCAIEVLVLLLLLAEYVLIGTLLSSGLAIIIAAAVQRLQ